MADPSRRARTLSLCLVGAGALVAAFVAVEARRLSLEGDDRRALAAEANRRGLEITAQTLNGNVMGSAAALGLVDHSIKSVVRRELRPDDPAVLDKLAAIGLLHQARGVFLVGRDGIVLSSWEQIGKEITGLDVSFRQYFKIALEGRQTVYAAVGMPTRERSIFFAAPIFADAQSNSPAIGAIVVRLDLRIIDKMLDSWADPAILIAPQGIAFASNRRPWIMTITRDLTPDQIGSISASHQFGDLAETGTVARLPADIGRSTASVDGIRYAVARAPVDWNDPAGGWSLALLSNLDTVMPLPQKILFGLPSAGAVLLIAALGRIWRRRVRQADDQRRLAETALQRYVERLKQDVDRKEFLGALSACVHQATDSSDFGRRLFSTLTAKLDAHYAALYVQDHDRSQLVPVCGHGVILDELQPVAVGQGLVGQCGKDGAALYIGAGQGCDIRFQWGEGTITPQAIGFLPLVQGDRTLGVLVLASMQDFDAAQRALLDDVTSESAASLAVLLRTLDSQRQGEAVQAAQRHLQQTETRYRRIIDSLAGAVMLVDSRGSIIHSSPQLDQLFGFAPGMTLGQKAASLLPDIVWPDPTPGHATLAAPQDGAQRSRGIARNGAVLSVDIDLTDLPAEGKLGRWLCVAVRAAADGWRQPGRGLQADPA